MMMTRRKGKENQMSNAFVVVISTNHTISTNVTTMDHAETTGTMQTCVVNIMDNIVGVTALIIPKTGTIDMDTTIRIETTILGDETIEMDVVEAIMVPHTTITTVVPINSTITKIGIKITIRNSRMVLIRTMDT